MVIEMRQKNESQMAPWLDTLPEYEDFNTILFNWPDEFDELLPGQYFLAQIVLLTGNFRSI